MAKNSDKDKRMAAELKSRGDERTTHRCPVCYRVVSCDSSKSKNKHIGNCFK